MVKVIYFDAYGRAEAIRMLLSKAGVAFEDERHTFAEWFGGKKVETASEFGQLPIVEIDGKQYTQTGSILRLLGKQHGYYSEDPYTAW
jgi:glutathione S-transferase